MTIQYERNRICINILRQFHDMQKAEIGPYDTERFCIRQAARFYSFRDRLRQDRDGYARDLYAIARCVSVGIHQRPNGTWWLHFYEDPLEKLRRAGALRRPTK